MAARLGVLQSIWNRVWWQERCGSRKFRKCHGQRELITNEKVIERMDMSKESLRTITEVHLGLCGISIPKSVSQQSQYIQ